MGSQVDPWMTNFGFFLAKNRFFKSKPLFWFGLSFIKISKYRNFKVDFATNCCWYWILLQIFYLLIKLFGPQYYYRRKICFKKFIIFLNNEKVSFRYKWACEHETFPKQIESQGALACRIKGFHADSFPKCSQFRYYRKLELAELARIRQDFSINPLIWLIRGFMLKSWRILAWNP